MRTISIIFGTLLFLLAGFNPSYSQQAQKSLEEAANECLLFYPKTTEDARPIAPRMQCLTATIMRYQPSNSQFRDLAEVWTKTCLVLAERYDAGLLTKAEWNLQMAQADSQLWSAQLQRQS